VREAVQVKWFSLEETKLLYADYQRERGLTLDDRIVEDIHSRTAGYSHCFF